MRIAIYGTGGVGGYFGGRLALAGNDVSFIARGEHLRALNDTGLRVESLKGDFIVSPVRATDNPSQLGTVDVVIVGVKAWQVIEAARAMRPLIDADTVVLPLQNGVEASEQLSSVLGEEHVLGGLCRIVSYLAGPGHIRHAGFAPSVALGELNNRFSPRVDRLREVFAKAGIAAEVPPDIHSALWSKFLFISAYSGVGAVTQAPAGVLRRLSQTRSLMECAMQEIYSVAQAKAIRLPADAVAQALATLDRLPENATSSLQRDVLAGRPSELEAQSGTVVRLGAAVNVNTPVNSFIYNSLVALELKARGALSFPQ